MRPGLRINRLRVEHLEDRTTPAFTPIGRVAIPGFNSAWNFATGPQLDAAPVAADINGNGTDEIIVPGGDKNVHAFTVTEGANNTVTLSLLRSFTNPGTGEIRTTPVVTDVPGVGRVIFAAGTDGKVFGWNATTGQLLPGWPQSVQPPASVGSLVDANNDVYGGVAAGDLDGDGVPEVVITSRNHEVTAFRMNGSVMWRFNADDTVFTTPLIADIDRDGLPDVIVGGDASQNAFFDAGGNIIALSNTGQRKWVHHTTQVVQSSPIAADINGDGTLEIFAGTGLNFAGTGNFVYGLDSNGNDLPGWPFQIAAPQTDVSDGSIASPVAADVNGDGRPDIIIGDRTGNIHVISGAGTGEIRSISAFPGENLFASPVIADTNGDGVQDIIQTSGVIMRAYSTSTGDAVGVTVDDGSSNTNGPGNARLVSSPVVGRFRPAGGFQVAYYSNASDANGLRSPSELRVFDMTPTTATPAWPQQRRNAQNNAIDRNDDLNIATIDNLFRVALNRGATPTEGATYRAAFDSAQSITQPAFQILTSTEARNLQITGYFTTYLGRSPSQQDLSDYRAIFAQPRSDAFVQANVIGSQEGFNRGGGTNQGWVTFLYQRVLGRTPSGGEDQYWVSGLNSGAFNRPDVAYGFLLSKEYSQAIVRNLYRLYGFGTPSADSLQTAGYVLRAPDRNFNRNTEERATALLLASRGDFTATERNGSYLRALYQDVLGRSISAGELINWMTVIEDQRAPLSVVASAVIRSGEANDRLVASWFATYLRRASTAGERAGYVSQLNTGTRRQDVLAQILGSTEYYASQGGSDPNTYITAVFTDLAGAANQPSQTARNYYLGMPVQQLRSQLPRDVQAQVGAAAFTLVRGMYFAALRRFPETPSDYSAVRTAGGSPPYYDATGAVNALLNGGDPADIQILIFSSLEYQNVALGKGFWLGDRFKLQ
jgi:hypothetical protein